MLIDYEECGVRSCVCLSKRQYDVCFLLFVRSDTGFTRSRYQIEFSLAPKHLSDAQSLARSDEPGQLFSLNDAASDIIFPCMACFNPWPLYNQGEQNETSYSFFLPLPCHKEFVDFHRCGRTMCSFGVQLSRLITLTPPTPPSHLVTDAICQASGNLSGEQKGICELCGELCGR